MTLFQLSRIINTHLQKNKPLRQCKQTINRYVKQNIYHSNSIYSRFIKQYNIGFNPYGYRHIPIYEMKHVEMYLIQWKPSSYSPIHDHHEKGCIMVLLDEKLIEHRYCSVTHKYIKSNYIPSYKAQYIDNYLSLHSIENPTCTNMALSLHIYPK